MSCDCLVFGTGEPCPEESTGTCQACRKRICPTHTDTAGDGRVYCPGCGLAEGVALCREKVGFLTVKDCKAQATAGCTMCQKPLCQSHAVASAQGVLCSECAETKGVAHQSERRRYSDYYYAGYHPHYWGSDRSYHRRHHSSSYYDERDAEIFDEHKGDTATDGDFDGDFEAS